MTQQLVATFVFAVPALYFIDTEVDGLVWLVDGSTQERVVAGVEPMGPHVYKWVRLSIEQGSSANGWTQISLTAPYLSMQRQLLVSGSQFLSLAPKYGMSDAIP